MSAVAIRDNAARATNKKAQEIVDALNTELERLSENAAKVDELESANRKRIELLRGMLDGWRDYAKGHYCQTYNAGMAEGLESAAIALEAFLDGWEKSLQALSAAQ